MNEARLLALDVLVRCERDRKPTDPLLAPLLANSQLKEVDRRFVKMLVQTTHRWRGRADRVLEKRLRHGTRSLELEIHNILRLGYIQLFHMDSIPAHAAVNTAVEMAWRYGSEGKARLVNRILRGLISQKPDESDWRWGRDYEALGGELSHPDWLLGRWLSRYGEEAAREICQWNNRSPQIHLRIHGGAAARERVIAYLEEKKIEYVPGKLAPEAIRVRGRFTIPRNPLLSAGLITIQDESQMLVGRLWPEKAGGPIFDICGAPGTKTAHLCDLNPDADVISADLTLRRMKRVAHTKRRLGAENLLPVVADGNAPPFLDTFSRVLLDAPCSGLGVLQRRPDARWLRTPQGIVAAALLQSRLLKTAGTLVKPGGYLLYSLCSLEPEESVDQVNIFLRQHPNFKMAELPEWVPAALRPFPGMVCVMPGTLGMEGMYAALLRNTGGEK